MIIKVLFDDFHSMLLQALNIFTPLLSFLPKNCKNGIKNENAKKTKK